MIMEPAGEERHLRKLIKLMRMICTDFSRLNSEYVTATNLGFKEEIWVLT